MKMKLIKLQIAVISLTLFACDKTTAAKKSDNDGATDKSNYEIGDEVGFLKASDVRTRSSLTKIDKKDLSDIINDMSFFYYTAPDEEENKCTTKLNTTKLAASGHRITIETNLDLMTCFDGKIDYLTSATTRNYFQGTCSDKKLDEHDNKGLADFQKELKNINVCGESGASQAISQTETIYKYKVENEEDGKTYKYTETTRTVQAAKQGDGCKFKYTNDTWVTEDCRFSLSREISDYTIDGEAYESEDFDFYQFDADTLKANASDKFYQSGSMTISFNYWSGTLTYSDADTPPTWKVSNKGESASGSLKKSSLRLNAGSPFGKTGHFYAPEIPKPRIFIK